MNGGAGFFCALVAFFAFADAGRAHSVHVFAFVDGDAIQVDAYFAKKRKVRHGRLVVTDAETGATIHEGVTDENGLYRFRPPASFLTAGHGLHIRLHAGEGHQDDWRMAADEVRTLSAAPSAAPPREHPPAPAAPLPETVAATGDASEWERLIGRVVDAKLAPIKRALARQEERAPDFRDIVGGLGWIVGLLGMGTYVNYRRRTRHERG